MPAFAPPSAPFRRHLGFLNSARLRWLRLSRRFKSFHPNLPKARPRADYKLNSKTSSSSKSGTNSASYRIRSYFSPVAKFFDWYSRQQHHRPYITELCSTPLIYCLGDFTAQMLGADDYDPYRTVRSITIGAVASIPSYKWFLFLGRNFNYSSATVSIGIKVLLNQLAYTPLFNIYFFAFHAILSGGGITGVIERVKNTVPTSIPRSFLYWPFVTAFNFTYVRPQSRSVATGVFAVFWQSYLSWLNTQAKKYERSSTSTFSPPQ